MNTLFKCSGCGSSSTRRREGDDIVGCRFGGCESDDGVLLYNADEHDGRSWCDYGYSLKQVDVLLVNRVKSDCHASNKWNSLLMFWTLFVDGICLRSCPSPRGAVTLLLLFIRPVMQSKAFTTIARLPAKKPTAPWKSSTESLTNQEHSIPTFES